MDSYTVPDISAVARELGFEFQPKATAILQFRSPLFAELRSEGCLLKNIMRGSRNGHDVTILEFNRYENDQEDPALRRTAICISSDRIEWPRTTLRPYGTADRVADRLFGEKPLRGGSSDASRFSVEGLEPDWPGLFDDRLSEFLLEHGDLSVHLGTGELIICRSHSRLEPYEIQPYLEQAEQLLEVVTTFEPPQVESGLEPPRFTEVLMHSQRPKLEWSILSIVAVLVLSFCGFHLRNSYRQWSTGEYSETTARITAALYSGNEEGNPDGSELCLLQYEYEVIGQRFTGTADNRRFVWRPIRQGDDRARKLSRNWRQGLDASVFYNPNQPVVSVLDNSFTAGDAEFAKLMSGISIICLAILFWPLVKRFALPKLFPFPERHTGEGRSAYWLPRAPYTLDTFAFLLVPSMIYAMAWLASLPLRPSEIMESVQYWVWLILLINVVAVPVVYVWECRWRGECMLVVDTNNGTLVISRPGNQPPLTLRFEQVQGIQISETNRTQQSFSVLSAFDPVLKYVDDLDIEHEIVLTRYFFAAHARQLARWIRADVDVPLRSKPLKKQSQSENIAASARTGKESKSVGEWTFEDLQFLIMTVTVIVVVSAITGFHEIALAIVALAAIAVLVVPICLRDRFQA